MGRLRENGRRFTAENAEFAENLTGFLSAVSAVSAVNDFFTGF
jgi:hypothetical protein